MNVWVVLEQLNDSDFRATSYAPVPLVAEAATRVEEQLRAWFTQVRKARDAARLARAYDRLKQTSPVTTVRCSAKLRELLYRVGCRHA